MSFPIITCEHGTLRCFPCAACETEARLMRAVESGAAAVACADALRADAADRAVLPLHTILVGPKFERDASEPAPLAGSLVAWSVLYRHTVDELRNLGCKPWEEPDAFGRVLMLFPAEWYEHVPEGFVVESISGKRERFRPGVTGKDRREGVLAFGLKVRS